MKFHTIEAAIADIKRGRMVIVVDDEDRENEGDLVMAAEKVTTSWRSTAGGSSACRSPPSASTS
jgi:3,4-dihydroxy-2-butanone 4-phosphate synthase